MQQAQFKLDPKSHKDRIFFKSSKDPLRISHFINDYITDTIVGEKSSSAIHREHEKMKEKRVEIFETSLLLGKRRSCLQVFFSIPAFLRLLLLLLQKPTPSLILRYNTSKFFLNVIKRPGLLWRYNKTRMQTGGIWSVTMMDLDPDL